MTGVTWAGLAFYLVERVFILMLISEKIRDYCLKNNLNYYRKRSLVADELQETNTPSTAIDLWLRVSAKGSKVSFPSVYIILKWLVDHGFAEKTGQSGKKTLFRIIAVEDSESSTA